MSQRSFGKVKLLAERQAYGFINGDDGGQYFFHRSQTEHWDALAPGDPVSFRITPSVRKPGTLQAVAVEPH